MQEPDGSWQAMTASVREAHPAGITVYNFEVGQDHTYFVADADTSFSDPVWVHNADYDCGPNLTKEFHSNSQVIVRGPDIDKIDTLVTLFGGTRSGWTKKKSWDEFGQEWHWYQHHGIGIKGMKMAGEPDPF